MSDLRKARRTQHFPDPKLEHQLDELVRAINAGLDMLEKLGVDIDQQIARHAADESLHITRDYRDAMDRSLVHPSATNPFVTEESLNDAMTGSAKPGVQTLEDLAAIPPDQRADKDTRLVEDEGKIYRFDADADHGDVKPLEGPGWWIAVAAATQNHNNLSNLQGGSATERYHLTKAERDSLVAHLADTNNPHQVTAAQVGAYPAGSTVADSERLNGQPASYYTNIPARLGYTPVNKAGDTMTGELKLEGQHVVIKRPSTSGGWACGLDQRSGDDSSTREAGIGFLGSGQNPPHTIYLGFGDSPWTGGRGVLITEDGVTFKGNKVWHAGNDGSGSGLDADLLDGQHGSYYASKASVDDVSAAVNSVSLALTTHKSSGDHDGRYYTKSQLNTSGGGGQVHWNNITGKPSIPGSPVPVSQLKRANGSFSRSVAGEESFSQAVTVHQYAFASPSSYASASSTSGSVAIGRFVNDTSSVRKWLFQAYRTSSSGTATAYWTWDYLTASGHPRVWAEVDNRGEIYAMWEAEDPADPDFPDESPIQVSRDADGNPLPGRLVMPLLMPDEWAISAVHDRLLTAPQGQWLTQSRFATLGDPVSIHRSMVDEQLRERGLEIPDDIRAVFTDIKDYDRRHWYLQLWLRQASRLLYDHRPSTLIPLYRDMFRVDRRTGRLVLR